MTLLAAQCNFPRKENQTHTASNLLCRTNHLDRLVPLANLFGQPKLTFGHVSDGLADCLASQLDIHRHRLFNVQ